MTVVKFPDILAPDHFPAHSVYPLGLCFFSLQLSLINTSVYGKIRRNDHCSLFPYGESFKHQHTFSSLFTTCLQNFYAMSFCLFVCLALRRLWGDGITAFSYLVEKRQVAAGSTQC